MNSDFKLDNIPAEMEVEDYEINKTFGKTETKSCNNSISFGNNDFSNFVSFNSSTISRKSISNLKSKDIILSYNVHTKSLLKNNGIESNLVPPAIERRSYKNVEPLIIEGKREFSFLSVVDTSRGHMWVDTVRSFCKAFDGNKDVCLILKTYGGEFNIYQQSDAMRQIVKVKSGFADPPAIIFIGSKMSQKEMVSLYSSCDVFVKLYNIDIGMTFIEAVACGNVCIGPETGVAREIISSSSSIIVNKEKEIRDDSGIIYDIYDNDYLTYSMRHAIDNYDSLKDKLLKERKLTLSSFDRNSVSLKLLKAIKHLS
jgi:glycosyltransferase involved in cell wall biosynthesis